jgi:hypothetical protein
MPLQPREPADVVRMVSRAAMAVQENTAYRERVNDRVIEKILPRRTKVVILSQNPPPGEDVPLGTVVNITLAVKDDLPMESLGAQPAVSAKWKNAALVENAVVNAGPSAPALQAILTAKPDYALLTDSDRTLFDTFINAQGLGTVDKAKVYSDVQFAYTL